MKIAGFRKSGIAGVITLPLRRFPLCRGRAVARPPLVSLVSLACALAAGCATAPGQ
ncbi:hypothetical protein [Burkholderia sp. F1]|uniref:hypothetical protein n=1 Tax=Burkholderia sp. F1 TaxID=3366817 RepID=UPI003D70F7DA